MNERVALLGAGQMGEALLAGLLRSGTPAEELLVTVRRPERAAELRAGYGVAVVSSAEAAGQAGTLVLAVKPQDMAALLDELAPALPAGALLISLAAGVRTRSIEHRLADGVAVVRVMSNTAVRVGEAMSVLCAGAHADQSHLARAETLLGAVGRVLVLPESQLDAATALSGSGPAYFFYLVEAMTDAGILLGLPRAVAHELLVQTAVGAALLLRETGEHPVALREAVTSPAGTTINAIRELENHRVRAAFLAALQAARDRSGELAAEQEGRLAR